MTILAPPELIRYLFSFDPDNILKIVIQAAALVATTLTIGTTLATKTWPWLKAKRDSRSISKRLGAKLFPVENVKRALHYYVPPYSQNIDPAGGEDPRLVLGVRQKLFEVLDRALIHPTEYNFIILLADSGMGKTSALLNYYARHTRRWRKQFKIVVIPLGIPDVDVRITAVPDKEETVIFLDALDEDILALVDHIDRLRKLLNATSDFHRVLISCRTQFFSRDEEIPKETGILKVGVIDAGERREHVFHKIYLSHFSDKEVTNYLKRRYPWWRLMRRRRAYRMVMKIDNLIIRPMLLAHIDELLDSGSQIQHSFQLHEAMVKAWLKRERISVERQRDLLNFSKLLAVNLFVNRVARKSERLPRVELAALAQQWGTSLDQRELTGQSLLNRDAEGHIKFAHRSIMEYLFVVSFLEGVNECLTVRWTDQMLTFLWEIFDVAKHHGRDHPYYGKDREFLRDDGKGKELIYDLLLHAIKSPNIKLHSDNLDQWTIFLEACLALLNSYKSPSRASIALYKFSKPIKLVYGDIQSEIVTRIKFVTSISIWDGEFEYKPAPGESEIDTIHWTPEIDERFSLVLTSRDTIIHLHSNKHAYAILLAPNELITYLILITSQDHWIQEEVKKLQNKLYPKVVNVRVL